MARYEVFEKNKYSKVSVNGLLNPSKLQENGVDVLTIASIAKDLNDNNENKVPSIKLLKYIIDNSMVTNNSSGSNAIASKQDILNSVSSIFLKNFINSIDKEKEETLSKINILTNAEVTPELVGDNIREDLISSSMEYVSLCEEVNKYVNNILDNNISIDENVELELNSKSKYYNEKLVRITENTQRANNRLAQIKSDIALEEANKHTDTIANQIVYKLEIHSSNGSIFKKGTIDTTLTAVLYKGKEIVTNEFLPIRFVWTRKSHDELSDERWNSSSRRDYSIKITTSDMIGSQCTFNCTVLDEEGNKIVSAY